MNLKFIVSALIGIAIVFGVTFFIVGITSDIKKANEPITKENVNERLKEMVADIKVTKEPLVKGQIDLDPVDVASELPDISKFEVSVENTTDSYIEIFSSTEKSGKEKDGWLNEVANDFNEKKFEVNGKVVSVKIRNIASGTAVDYIKSGKYVPDAFTPSNELWGEMVQANGVKTELITKRLVGNVPGIVISNAKHEQLKKKYKNVNVQTVIDAMNQNEFAMGYTDPFASSTGINFLMTALHTFDSKNPLSDKSTQQFEQFQQNVPFIASTTLQMREAAKSGALDGFVLEYQTYLNASELKNSYQFTPFGVRHDSPLYALGNVTKDKLEIVKKFGEFATQSNYQSIAKEYGFNQQDNYQSTLSKVDGSTLIQAQKLWKDKKNGNKSIMAVFVADTSGSMAGEPIQKLKESLSKGQKYLGKNNYIGFVTYSSDVSIQLPIGLYDTNQQSHFVGAIDTLQANGGTATYDAVIIAADMLLKEMEKTPNVKPMIFVLSDGNVSDGHSFTPVSNLIRTLKIPVHTIGYNADFEELRKLSNINEAANINADSEDVTYQIKNLLNVQM